MSDDSELSQIKTRLQHVERENARMAKELKQVKQERIEYLQNVSHQLVAPLNAIKWHIENLNAGRMDLERAKKVLRSIYSQSTIAVHLAKNFALMSNLEADHALNALKEPLQEVSLCGLLVNLADDFQPLGWDKEIDIGVEEVTFAEAPNVLVMKPLISQVFSNIIENAVKYSNKTTQIVIDGKYEKEIDAVSVNVRNRGIRLPDRTELVFERGFRSNDARNRYPAGTGFGMYIAERIVEIHEGEIMASLDEKGRTTFTVTLSVSSLKGKARFRAPKHNTVS
jgi:signal transduction histidine kinase